MSFGGSIENIRKALDSSAIVAITDPQGNIKYVNSKFIEISQYSEQELLGQNHRIINSGYHPRSFFENIWSTILSGARWEGEICNRAKDGSLYWVHTIIVPFSNSEGEIEEFISIRWDITARKSTEEKLRNTTNDLENLIDASFDAILIYDLSGRISWCNSATERIFSVSQAELINAQIEKILTERYVPFKIETSSLPVQINNENKILEISTKPYHFQYHKAYLATVKDVTEKVILESKILQQERLASVGILASGLAHEIGTPLGIVRGRAEMMALQPDVSSVVLNGAQIIIQQIDRVSHLIQNLLKLARGQKEESPQRVHVLSLISDVEDFLSYELKKNSIALIVEIPDRFEILGIYNSLFQVVLNLLVNSIHAIQDKKKQADDTKGSIHLWAEVRDSFSILHVTDNGCGMSEDVLEKIFVPFFTTKEVGKGTGLGLATSYKILQSWGGFLSAKSEFGIGSTISIHIPYRN